MTNSTNRNMILMSLTTIILSGALIGGVLLITSKSSQKAPTTSSYATAHGQTIGGSSSKVTSKTKSEASSKNKAEDSQTAVTVSPKSDGTTIVGKATQIQTTVPGTTAQNQSSSLSNKAVSQIEKQVDTNPTYIKQLTSDPKDIEVIPLKLGDNSYMVTNHQVLITTAKDGSQSFTTLASPSDWALFQVNSKLSTSDYSTLVKYFNTVNQYLVNNNITLVIAN